MKKTKLIAIAFALMSFFFCFCNEAEAAAKIALVDVRQIMLNYDQAKQAQADLSANQEKIKKMIADARNQIKGIKDDKAKDKKEKELTDQILEKNKALSATFSDKWNKVQDKILATIKKIADNGKYDLVIDKNTVIAGGEDITDKVLKELKKK